MVTSDFCTFLAAIAPLISRSRCLSFVEKRLKRRKKEEPRVSAQNQPLAVNFP
jgi:hypothetical protein